MFIHQSDCRRYGKLSKELENSFTKENDDYPYNLVSACHLINEYKCWQPKTTAPGSSGVAFSQKGKPKNDKDKNKDDSWQKKATCHHCGEIGHIRRKCPTLQDDADKDTNSDKINSQPKSLKEKKTSEKKKKKVSFPQQHKETDNDKSEPKNQFLSFGFCKTSNAPIKL
jgi:hypothetical protein